MPLSGSGVVVSAALAQLGKRYVWDTPVNFAEPDPPTFDCSGLTGWSWHKGGVSLPHQTQLQYNATKHRPLAEAEPGDLVFFGPMGAIYHVGLYIGNSEIVEAPDISIPVRTRKISAASTDIVKNVGIYPGSQSTSGASFTSAQPATSTVTYRQFFTDVLHGIGAPVTQSNLDALAVVAIIEGANDRYNPLNSSVPAGHSTSFNSSGVQDYGSYSNGVAGTVALLQGSAWHGVTSALKQGTSMGSVLSEFASEYATWGSHPAFSSISVTNANALLGKSIGVASATSNHLGAPYDPAKLHVPLSNTQRAAIIAWLGTVSNQIQGIPSPSALMKSSDAVLIAQYTASYTLAQMLGTGITGPGSLLPDWAGALSKILSWLSDVKNWERIGLYALGGLIVIFTGRELLQNG